MLTSVQNCKRRPQVLKEKCALFSPPENVKTTVHYALSLANSLLTTNTSVLRLSCASKCEEVEQRQQTSPTPQCQIARAASCLGVSQSLFVSSVHRNGNSEPSHFFS